MKKSIFILLCSLITAPIWAANPVPYTEGVSFSTGLTGTVTNMATVTGESSVSVSDSVTSATTIHESDMATVPLRPGKQYTVTFAGSGTGQYWLSVVAPQGYAVYIDNLQTDLATRAVSSSGYNYTHTVEIRPIASVAGADIGTFSGIDIGKSVTWEVGLGNLRTGRSAGKILFKELDLTNSPVSRERLYYAAPPANVGQIVTVYDTTAPHALKQICTPVGFVDIVDDPSSPSNGYTFKFYSWSDVTGWTGFCYTFGGTPWKTIRVQSSGTSKITITETHGSVVRVSYLELTSGSVSSGAYVWTLKEGGGTTPTWLRTTIHSSTVPSSGLRFDIAEVHTGDSTASGTLVAKTRYNYATKPWMNEELTDIIADPDTGGAQLTTSYAYYETAPTTGSDAQRGNYRKVKSVSMPTGNWILSEYYDDWDTRGELLNEYHQYVDSVITSLSTGRVVNYTYVADWTGRKRSPLLRQESINGVVTGKTAWALDSSSNSGSPRDKNDVSYYSDASDSHNERQESIRADADPDEAGHPYLLKKADLSQTSWSVSRGTYNPSTNVFTVSSTGDHWRELKFNGSTSSSGATAVTSFDGQSCESIEMVPNKSTLEITIRIAQGVVYHTETQVYTGTGTTGFFPMTYTDYTYDGYGRLTQSLANNGALTTYSYTDGQLTSTVDPTGIETQFHYDLIGRVDYSTKKGASAGAYAAQADITTTYTLDGANHATQTDVTASGASTQTTTAWYDLCGRLTQQVNNATASDTTKCFTTSYRYTAGGKIVTATLPSVSGFTRTTVTEIYPDGQTKSITGSAQVAEYYGYRVISGGFKVQDHWLASSGSAAWTAKVWYWNGPLYQDWRMGGDGSYYSEYYVYNTLGQLSYIWHGDGKGDHCFEYDTLGKVVREGDDLNSNGVLDLSSSDRITDYAWQYFSPSGGVWWRRDTTTTYATLSSSAPTQVARVDTQLSGFTAAGSGYTRLSRVDSYDVFGNMTTTYYEVANYGKMAVATTVAPNSSTNAVQTFYNGLLMSSQDTTGVTTTYGYDSLGRQTASIDPRTVGTGLGTVTAYISGTSLVATVTDPNYKVQATYAYDTAGQVKSVMNVLNKYAYYEYYPTGQKKREWGDTTIPVEYAYDTYGRQYTMTTYASSTATFTGSSWPSSPSSPQVTTWNHQDSTGLLSSKVDASGHTVSYTYTAAGMISTRQWARILSGTTHVTTTYSYDTATRGLTGVTYNDSVTPSLTFTYNRLGQQATAGDTTTGTHTFNYNLGSTLELQNEIVGTSSSDFYGDRRITRGYDTATGAVGRYNRLSVGSSSNAYSDYDMSYGYDSVGRLNQSFWFSYTYVTNSHLIQSVGYPGWNYTDTRTYHSHYDWPTQRKTTWGSTPVIQAQFDYQYDDMGRITQVAKTSDNTSTSGMFNRYGNGSEGLTTYYGYDDLSQLKSDVTKVGTSSTAILPGRNDSAFSYDNMGNRTLVTHNGTSLSYTPNTLNQYDSRAVAGAFDVAGSAPGSTVTVTGGGTSDTAARSASGSYYFDAYALTNTSTPVFATLTATDNTTPTPYTSSTSAYLAKTPESFNSTGTTDGYDYDGNLLKDGRWSYTYDAENRLIQMRTLAAVVGSAPLMPATKAQKLVFAYDYLGRRARKTRYEGYNASTDTFSSTSVEDTKFLYDGWNLIKEFDGSLNPVRNYVWGLDLSGTLQGAGGVGGLLLTYDYATSKILIPLYDAMGNVAGTVDASSGTLAAAYEYDAFGNTLRESGTYAGSNPFQFSTKYTDVETSLIYYGQRYYSPSLGRFINQDPIEEDGGLNLYGFCGNNGVNDYDYLGMLLETINGKTYDVAPIPTDVFNPAAYPNSAGYIFDQSNWGFSVSAFVGTTPGFSLTGSSGYTYVGKLVTGSSGTGSTSNNSGGTSGTPGVAPAGSTPGSFIINGQEWTVVSVRPGAS